MGTILTRGGTHSQRGNYPSIFRISKRSGKITMKMEPKIPLDKNGAKDETA